MHVQTTFGRHIRYTIRPAKATDRDQVYLLACQLAPAFVIDRHAFEASYTTLLQDPAVYLHVADAAEQAVAYLLGWTHRAFFANGAVAWVQEIVVSPEHRRGRLGQSLMSHFEAWSLERDVRVVSLTSKRARDFYRAIGYAESPATYFKKSL